MSDDDITRIRLPHTGLRVPDRSLTLTGYRMRPTGGGGWFKASVHVNGKKVGVVENLGLGGPTGLSADDEAVFKTLDEYAGQCLTEEGDPVTNLEELLDELVTEHDFTVKIGEADKLGKLLLRLMAYVLVGADDEPIAGFPPRTMTTTAAAIPPGKKHWAALATALLETSDLTPGDLGWWQAWYENRWQDITRRPDRAADHLYG